MERMSGRDALQSAQGTVPQIRPGRSAPGYALILPARNEERFIRLALDSVASQTVRPEILVIALNDCTDGTPEIVAKYVDRYPWMIFRHWEFSGPRRFSRKAEAFAKAFELIRDMRLGFIGNLDADVSLPVDYYERILAEFSADPALGVAGGVFDEAGGSGLRNFDSYRGSVNGLNQMFRWECYQAIGGYRPISTGGIDMAADTLARYHGWRTRSFPSIRCTHHRPVGMADQTRLRAKFSEGVRDYHMGYGFVFHALKCLRRLAEKPVAAGSLARMAGYLMSMARRRPYALPGPVRAFLRAEQWRRMLELLRRRGERTRISSGFPEGPALCRGARPLQRT